MLEIDVGGDIQLGLENFFGESVAVLGIKGSGKTNTSAVLIEELLAAHVPLTIVDIEDEYYGLKERFDLLIVGRSENADMDVPIGGAAALAAFSIGQGVSIILELSEHDEDDAHEFLLTYFEALFEAASKKRQPYMVVLEEAHEFIPQGIRTPLKKILNRIALRGRKRGLGTIMISQRSAKVEKDLLTQAGLVFLHTVAHPADMVVYQDILGLSKGETISRVSQLQRGQAIVKHYGEINTVQVRRRHTFHAGATPGLDASAAPALRKIDDAMLAELKKLTEKHSVGRGQNQVDVLLRQLRETQNTITEQEETIRQLQEQVEIYRKLEVQWTQPVVVGVDEKMAVRAAKNGTENHVQTMPATNDEYRTELALKRAIARQRRLFERVLFKVKNMKNRELQLQVLQFLHERAGFEFDLNEIARRLGYMPSTLHGKPPSPLVELGFVRRVKNGKFSHYTDNLDFELGQNFPDLDVEDLKAEIFSLVKS